MKGILTYLEQNLSNIIEDIFYIVASESPSKEKQLVDQCGSRIQSLVMKYFRLSPEIFEDTTFGNHLKYTFGDGEDTILLLTHFDTVWEKGKIQIRREGDKLYGPGILDMKAGIIQVLWALKTCKDFGLPLKKKIVLLCTSDEEVGSPSSKKIILKEAQASNCVLVMEPPVAGTGALKTSRKSISNYFIKIKGKTSHAGNNHQSGISAIREGAKIIEYLESLTDYEKGTTVNVGLVQGGERLNVVPGYCKIGIDVRTRTLDEQKRMDKIIRSTKPFTKGIKLQITGGMERPPMLANEGTKKLAAIAQNIGNQIGLNLPEAAVGGGSDGNFTSNLGIPTLDGLGAFGDGAHSKTEHIIISELPKRITLLTQLLLSL